MTTSRGNLARHRAAIEGQAEVTPPRPVDSQHPCYCGKLDFTWVHQIGDHPEFWANPPKQGLISP